MSDLTPGTAHRASLARSVRLLGAFRREQSDPEYFYGLLAEDTIAQLGSYAALTGATVIDVGAGSGFFTRELARAGARSVGLDCDAGEMTAFGPPRGASLLGSAMRLPLRDEVADVCFSSNVLEHVSEPWRMADEMVRVTRPGGIVYLSFTNWLSPWGGHETSPWHYLGGARAARRYTRRNGRPPKNLYGEGLHAVSVAGTLAWARGRADIEVLDALPRYHPRWAQGVVRIPVVREVATWNLVLVLRKLSITL